MTLPALVFWALVVLVAYKQAKNWVNWQKFRIWARSQGCLEPAIVPNYLPGGLERYIRFFMYAKGKHSQNLSFNAVLLTYQQVLISWKTLWSLGSKA